MVCTVPSSEFGLEAFDFLLGVEVSVRGGDECGDDFVALPLMKFAMVEGCYGHRWFRLSKEDGDLQ